MPSSSVLFFSAFLEEAAAAGGGGGRRRRAEVNHAEVKEGRASGERASEGEKNGRLEAHTNKKKFRKRSV